MLRKIQNFILTSGLIGFALLPSAAVQAGQPPVGTCPPGFELHEMHEMMDHDHHIGLKDDLNNDGYLCVKHLPNGLHVHMDNVVRSHAK